jgi:peptidoglycan/LPS O-acetylase OafA/YrhL
LNEIKEITGMRGLAAQAVIFFHFCAISPLLQSIMLSTIAVPLAWNSGVDFFFVLSGFLLAIPFMQLKKIDFGSYYVKRCLRIFPAYYVSLVFIVLFLSKHVTFQDILTTAFFSQNFFQSTFTTINGVYWTLAIEEIFYATLPLFAIFFIRGRWMYALPICIAFSTTYREVVYSLYHNQLNFLNFYLWQYPSYIEHYAIGISLAALFVQGTISVGKLKSSKPLVVIILILIASEFIIGRGYLQQAYDLPLANLVFAGEYGLLIAFTLASPVTARLRGIFTNKVSLFTGKISYSTYVWHLPIEIAIFSLNLPIIEWLILSYVAIMAVALLTYHFVEMPFLKLKNRISMTKRVNEKVQLQRNIPPITYGSHEEDSKREI